MIDEFQDTNPLQNELLGRIAGDRLFRVGDEFQSIYRFRHADVDPAGRRAPRWLLRLLLRDVLRQRRRSKTILMCIFQLFALS